MGQDWRRLDAGSNLNHGLDGGLNVRWTDLLWSLKPRCLRRGSLLLDLEAIGH